MSVAIGCIVRNRAWILPKYLRALEDISADAKIYVFLENDSTDNTYAILDDFVHRQADRAGVWLRRESWRGAPGHSRQEYHAGGYAHLANVRNMFLFMYFLTEADYLLSIDSDIIAPKDIVSKLLPLIRGRTIAAAAISNIPGRPLDGQTPGNFMIYSGKKLIHPPEYPLHGVFEVDVTGAVYLIPRRAIADGVRYGPHSQGEDVPFCQRAQQAGYRLVVNADVQCVHCMLEN